MAMTGKPVRKVYFTVGGMGLKPDKDFKIVSPGNFSKSKRGTKASISK